MPDVFQPYRRNVYSQNGEDGVIAELCRRLGIAGDWFCEFGAWDGRYGSNSYLLLRKGWSGVMIEGHPARFRRLASLAARHPERLHAIEALVGYAPEDPNTLDRLLARTPIPTDFAVLSIDIDSFDYQVWAETKLYRPKIVVIEVESSYPPDMRKIHADDSPGTSYLSMVELGRAKGYTAVVHTGNIIFVRDDLVPRLGERIDAFDDPARLFCSEWMNLNFYRDLRRRVVNLTPQRLAIKIDNHIHEWLGR